MERGKINFRHKSKMWGGTRVRWMIHEILHRSVR